MYADGQLVIDTVPYKNRHEGAFLHHQTILLPGQ